MGCQCAKGTQDTESSISHDTLKPDGVLITSANKKQKENFIQFSEVPTHVILMNDYFSEALTWTCYPDE